MVKALRPRRAAAALSPSAFAVREVSFKTGAVGLSATGGGGGATGSAFSILGLLKHMREGLFFLLSEEERRQVSDHPLFAYQCPKLTVRGVNGREPVRVYLLEILDHRPWNWRSSDFLIGKHLRSASGHHNGPQSNA
ncbi:hypothetical protein CYK37_30070 [Mesorhizobium loti]|nr:hypothetical protein CYK37_30070 [Mesorhizobium loti]